MAMRQPKDQPELPGINDPIGWSELGMLFDEHEDVHHRLEEDKAEVKRLKGEYAETQARLITAGKRVRLNRAAELGRIGNNALRNRHVDTSTGEIEE